MHTGPMRESDGTFSAPDPTRYTCRKCQQPSARRQVWESRCGAYEDEKFACEIPSCGAVWWVEGPDA